MGPFQLRPVGLGAIAAACVLAACTPSESGDEPDAGLAPADGGPLLETRVYGKVGPEGGVLRHPRTGAQLVVPPGALKEPVNLYMDLAEFGEAPYGGEGLGYLHDIWLPALARPAELALPVGRPATVEEHSLLHVAGGQFSIPSNPVAVFDSRFEPSSGMVRARILQAGIYGAVKTAGPAQVAPAAQLPDATVGQAVGAVAFSSALLASGPTWSAEGTLPPGLALGGSGNAILAGTPTEAGRYVFAMVGSDVARQHVRKVFQLDVRPAGAVTPVLEDLEPDWSHAEPDALTVKLAGRDFVPGMQALLNGRAIPTSYAGAGALLAILPRGARSSVGTLSLKVRAPGGAQSGEALFYVLVGQPNPVPAIANVSPAELEVGAEPAVVTVTVQGGVEGLYFEANGKRVASTPATAGTYGVTIGPDVARAPALVALRPVNPPPGGGPGAAREIRLQPKARRIVAGVTKGQGLAVVGTDIYWLRTMTWTDGFTQGTIWTVNTQDANPTPAQFAADGFATPRGPFADEANIYVLEDAASNNPNPIHYTVVNRSTQAVTRTVRPKGNPTSFFADQNYLYWNINAALYRVGKAPGGYPGAWISDAPSAISDGTVVWHTTTNQQLMSRNIATGATAMRLASGASYWQLKAADSENVYAQVGAQLVKVPRAGGDPVPLGNASCNHVFALPEGVYCVSKNLDLFPRAGGGPVRVISRTLGNAYDMPAATMDGRTLYWLENPGTDTGEIWSLELPQP